MLYCISPNSKRQVIELRYKIDLGCWNSVFAVPCTVVDEHIKLAGAASLKVMLYLLRHSGEDIDSAVLSERLCLHEQDIADALSYWTDCGVLCGQSDTLAPAQQSRPAEAQTIQQPEPAEEPKPAVKEEKAKISYTFAECAEIMARDSALRDMLEAVEGILKKQLTHREISLFITLCHWYGLPSEIAPLLAHYCVMLGKTSAAYIESVGIGWVNDGIDTSEKAEKRIRETGERRRAWRTVSDLLELEKRKPTEREENFCVTWLNEWHMPADVIREAYDRCINTKGKINFSYINGILSRWQTQGIDSVEKLAENEQKEKTKEPGGKGNGRYGSTHDLDEIDKMYWDEVMDDMGEED